MGRSKNGLDIIFALSSDPVSYGEPLRPMRWMKCCTAPRLASTLPLHSSEPVRAETPALPKIKRQPSEENRRFIGSRLLQGHRPTNLRCQSVFGEGNDYLLIPDSDCRSNAAAIIRLRTSMSASSLAASPRGMGCRSEISRRCRPPWPGRSG